MVDVEFAPSCLSFITHLSLVRSLALVSRASTLPFPPVLSSSLVRLLQREGRLTNQKKEKKDHTTTLATRNYTYASTHPTLFSLR